MSSVNVMCRKSISEKLVLAGGAAGLALASGTAAEAAVVSALNTPISPPAAAMSGNRWDVDGDATPDFELFNSLYKYASLTELNGGRFVVPNTGIIDGFAKLSSGFVVGPTMAGFKFFAAQQNGITATSFGTVVGSDLGTSGWSFGDVGFFGFKFTSGPNTYYGWGELDIHGGTAGQGITITQAYYNNTPGATIIVGDTGGAIPEPSTCALALLAAGGVAAYKGRRKRVAV